MRGPRELGALPLFSIFEPGFLRDVATLQRAGRLPAGGIVKLYFGGDLQVGLPPTPTALEAHLELLAPIGLRRGSPPPPHTPPPCVDRPFGSRGR
ncbi:hypothetical protein LWC35_21585 [Pseudonocardia kujensis]|uniref:hypothetical protein n=1 Tax=Pseudonocardia kujensis TaxID=1128675 RepID=UPI001E3780B4|nr:hypothetical protein [Pseudonocardia kujensis]MCE0765474.1 hypothetical protein [Pseudonocardia kujensis]